MVGWPVLKHELSSYNWWFCRFLKIHVVYNLFPSVVKSFQHRHQPHTLEKDGCHLMRTYKTRHVNQRLINNLRGLRYPPKKIKKASAPIFLFVVWYFFAMPVCAATVPVLILIYNIFCAKADLLLTVSRPEHVGPLSIKGSANETCRSVVEGANRCFLTEDCRGIVLYKSGTEKLCQTAICLPGPDVGSVNQVPGEAKIFLLFNGTFATGDYMLLLLYPRLSRWLYEISSKLRTF